MWDHQILDSPPMLRLQKPSCRTKRALLYCICLFLLATDFDESIRLLLLAAATTPTYSLRPLATQLRVVQAPLRRGRRVRASPGGRFPQGTRADEVLAAALPRAAPLPVVGALPGIRAGDVRGGQWRVPPDRGEDGGARPRGSRGGCCRGAVRGAVSGIHNKTAAIVEGGHCGEHNNVRRGMRTTTVQCY